MGGGGGGGGGIESDTLLVINPQCSYSVEENNIRGVALILNDLLQSLGIEHDNESSIQWKLRKRGDVKTTASKFFLKSMLSLWIWTERTVIPKAAY